MTAVALGLAVAAFYGAGDFFGGLATRRRRATVVVLWSQGAGLAGLLLLVPFLGGSPSGGDLGLGAAAGLVGLCGVLLLYRGLALGRMAVVAPVTAVGAAFVPFVAGAAGGEGLPATRLAGAVLALGGVVLVSRGHGGDGVAPAGPPEAVDATGSALSTDTTATTATTGSTDTSDTSDTTDVNRARAGSPRAEFGLALGAGAAFGLVFVLLGRLGDDAGLWPVLAQRAASVPALLAMTALARLPRTVTGANLRLIVPAGLCDAAANALFVLAARAGALSVVGVVSSLYPAVTVLLASLVLKERVSPSQGLGLLLAGAGVVLLAL